MEIFKLDIQDGKYVIDVDIDTLVDELQSYINNPQSRIPVNSELGGWHDKYLDDLKDVNGDATALRSFDYLELILDALSNKYDDAMTVDVENSIEPLTLEDLPPIAKVQLDMEVNGLPSFIPFTDLPSANQRENDTIPDYVIDDLLSYSKASTFKETLSYIEEINSYASQYGTMPLVISTVTDGRIEVLRKLLDDLLSVSAEFNESHSSLGANVIDKFVESVENARKTISGEAKDLRITNVRSTFMSLQTASEQLRNWLMTSWAQYGGEPENFKMKYNHETAELSALSAMF